MSASRAVSSASAKAPLSSAPSAALFLLRFAFGLHGKAATTFVPSSQDLKHGAPCKCSMYQAHQVGTASRMRGFPLAYPQMIYSFTQVRSECYIEKS